MRQSMGNINNFSKQLFRFSFILNKVMIHCHLLDLLLSLGNKKDKVNIKRVSIKATMMMMISLASDEQGKYCSADRHGFLPSFIFIASIDHSEQDIAGDREETRQPFYHLVLFIIVTYKSPSIILLLILLSFSWVTLLFSGQEASRLLYQYLVAGQGLGESPHQKLCS